METKMWSYKVVWDTMFAPNPLFDILTLATCKPRIRNSSKTQRGMWIAGWAACTTYNSDLFGGGVFRCKRGEERLIYLAQISDILPLDEYWDKYPQKRCVCSANINDAMRYGDNIYTKKHTDVDGNIIATANLGNHTGIEAAKKDYHNGKNAIICEKFFYFTPENRLIIPDRFKHLVPYGVGECIKSENVDNFIHFVTDQAKSHGVNNGIVGDIPIIYPKSTTIVDYRSSDYTSQIHSICNNNGCAK